MKFQVTVDLSDFYSEEEGESFSQAIKDYITNTVKKEVLDKFKATIFEEFTNAIKAKIEVEKNELIVNYINELVNSAKLKSGKYVSDGEVTILEYIKSELIAYNAKSSNFDTIITKAVKENANILALELKDRYDMLFASQIVMKLNEQGMLKEDVAKVLLNKDK